MYFPRPSAVASTCFLVAVLVLISSSEAVAQSTSFTYQGLVADTGSASATSGSYDFEFKLFDAATDGTQIGSTVSKSAVSVASGKFTVELDFGDQFPGAGRWLEIAIKRSSDTLFTTLAPRQKIASVPYAVRAANVSVASGNSVVTAINDSSTTDAISADKLSDGVAKIGVTEQSTTSTDMATPIINVKSVLNNGGTLTDFGRFRVGRDGSLLASGRYGTGTIPTTGPGTRMMWYPARAAFRAGEAFSTEWDENKIGYGSWAGGSYAEASGFYSFGLGYGVKATGYFSMAFGYNNDTSGDLGLSLGAYQECSGFNCVAIGEGNRALATRSVAIGQGNIVVGDYGVAIGSANIGAGQSSWAVGSGASACKVELVFPSGVPSCPSGSEVNYAFVWSDYNPDLPGSSRVSAQADREFRARAMGGFRFRTSNAANAAVGVDANVGCDLDNGSSTWTCASSRSLKTNFTPVSGEDLLGRLRTMPMTTWSFIGEQGAPRHLGPVAEDFYEAFKLGKSDKSIGVQDLAGVSLAATKALEERTAKLQAENDDLRVQLASLARRLESLEKAETKRRKTLPRSKRR